MMIKNTLPLLTLLISSSFTVHAIEPSHVDTPYFGVAYYTEYMPYERLSKDIEMMKAAHINVVRIGESTWATMEPEEGQFNFSPLDKVLDAMNEAGIKVIIGTQTYAIPSWLAKKYPDVLAVTASGQNKYGARQNMDITNPHYRYYAKRIINKMIAHVANHPAVIGYQIDNETKHYGTSGPEVQKAFVSYLQQTYPDINAFNREFGLDYWSNRIARWEDFPEVHGSVFDTPTTSINASITAEFAKFQRQLVTDFLQWEADLVNQYKRPDQFVTQNFDLDWRGYSYGLQSNVNHFKAAKAVDVAGIDIYHPTQNLLTGTEISFGGDMARSMKNGKNYFVIETEAQGFAEWTPYPGQLRLQAYSHLASGANMVGYWHWSSTHNAFETYWKGLLSHDFEPNPTYQEAAQIGGEFAQYGKQLANLKIHHDTAILVSNEAQTAFNEFRFGWGSQEKYNDILRPFYDALYRMNVGVDFISPSTLAEQIKHYKLVVVPALYAASDELLEQLNRYVEQGGHVVYTFKDGFSNEHVKVRSSHQPGIINASAGVYYSQFVKPEHVSLKGDLFGVDPDDVQIKYWMELVKPTTAKVLTHYQHAAWGDYAAITENQYGSGLATYIGFMPGDKLLEGILADAVKKAGIHTPAQSNHFPVIVKSGINDEGHSVHYLFNYSDKPIQAQYNFPNGKSLFDAQEVAQGSHVNLPAWGVSIIIEQK
ncbi:beta-galactosidase [Vibrio tritonius]|uniref:beta-galactosidase n=1 Tax=Vibrio tritonius TaxID=1435069 RepID=UPI00315DB6FD